MRLIKSENPKGQAGDLVELTAQGVDKFPVEEREAAAKIKGTGMAVAASLPEIEGRGRTRDCMHGVTINPRRQKGSNPFSLPKLESRSNSVHRSNSVQLRGFRRRRITSGGQIPSPAPILNEFGFLWARGTQGKMPIRRIPK